MIRAVSPLLDGSFDMDAGLFPDMASESKVASELLGLQNVPDVLEIPVWAFLVEASGHIALVDAGGGALMGPGFGGVAAAMQKAGFEAPDVGRVFLTHLHGDHCGGLIQADGAAAYPNARIAVGKSEVAFWTGSTVAEESSAIAADARRVLAAYEDRIDLVMPDDRIDGAQVVPAAGHTPGHIAWRFEALGAVAAGDIFHLPRVQVAKPDWRNKWDMDAEAARESRARILGEAMQYGQTLMCGHGGLIGPRALSAIAQNY